MAYTPLIHLQPALRLIDTVEVVAAGAGQGQLNAPVTQIDFGAAGDGFRQAAVGGAGVFDYQLEGDIFTILSNGEYRFQPNALATNQAGIGINSSGSTGPFGLGELHIMGGGVVAPATMRFVLKFTARDNQIRGFQSWAGQRRDGSAALNDFRLRSFYGTWEAPGAALNAFRILSSVAGSIGAGTLLSLYELRRRF